MPPLELHRRSTRIRPAASHAGREASPLWRAILVVCVSVMILSAGVLSGCSTVSNTASGASADTPAGTGSAAASAAPSVTLVEVPALTGMSARAAQTVLGAAGLKPSMRSESREAPDLRDVVVEQDPVAGAIVEQGTRVILVAKPGAHAEKAATDDAGSAAGDWVVCIDPGHQANSDSGPEPVGPGSKETKPRVSGGTTGIVTKVPEYEIALQIAVNLRKRLEAQGVTVVMTRDDNDTSLSNAERAKKANAAHADLFVRVHCDGSPRESTAGISTLYPAKTRWTKKTTGPSKRAARLVQTAVVERTGAVDRGIVARDDMTGFNWAKMPSVLVECGFMTNPVEDRLLASPHYQDKLAQGMTDGIMAYLSQEVR